MEYTEAIARFIDSLDFKDIPSAAVERAKQCLLDFVSVAAMAHQEQESTPVIRRAVQALAGGPGPGTVVGLREGLPFQYAALLNGALAHTLDFDDTNIRGSLHLGASILPAALAICEYRGARGTDLLTSMVGGYEVACRIGEALGLTAYDRGFHPTAIAGVFGATCAGGKVLGLKAPRLEAALGLNISQAAGSMQYLDNGAWNKRVHPGLAAHNALLSLFFSEAGFKGASRPLGGRFGLLKGYCDAPKPEKLVEGLGKEWVTVETGIKPYPSCRLTHGAVDAMIEVHKTLRPQVADVEEVKIFLSPKGYDIVGEPQPRKLRPEDSVDGQFSVYFQAAAALCEGAIRWETYSRLSDPQMRALISRMKVEKDSGLNIRTSRVVLKLRGGRVVEKLIQLPKGEPENPLSWDELIAKFTNCAAAVFSDDRRSAIVESVKSLETNPDAGSWVKSLRGDRLEKRD